VAGYVYDETGTTVRPIVGTPGAAVLEGPVDLGFSIAAAWVSPRRDILSVDAAGRIRLARATATSLIPVELPAGIRPPSAVVFSPQGTAAALWSQDILQVVSGLPGAPTLVFEARAAGLALAAVSDDGKTAVLLASAEDAPAWLVKEGGNLAAPVHAVAAAFEPGGGRLLLACPNGDLLLVSEDGVSSPVAAGIRITGIVGAAFSADGKRAFLASRSGQVAAVTLETGETREAGCNCRPSGLTPIFTAPWFRLTSGSENPTWVLDGSGIEPRILFIPLASQAVSRSDQ
jgi:hypothetical protein